MVDVVVVGHVGRDLVLVVDEVPDAGGGTAVRERHELLGGAANQAVGVRQMGWTAGLVGAIGSDAAAELVLDGARHDGLDVDGVVRRDGVPTALFVDVVTTDGSRRLLEHVPDALALTADDVRRSAGLLGSARAVLVQAQQPAAAVRAAAEVAHENGVLLAFDGALDKADPPGGVPAAVLRADAEEAAQLAGRRLTSPEDAVDAARDLVGRLAHVVAVSTGEEDVVVWSGGHVVLPLLGADPADVTGGGDAFLVGLVSGLLRGHDETTAAWWAAAAAALTVATVGGRPDLDERRVAELADRSRR